MGTSVLLSQKYRSTHTMFLHGNFSTSVAEVHKYTSSLSYLPPHLTRLIHRSTEYPYKVHVWELQYFCHRSTEVHKYTSSLSFLLPPDRSTEVLNIHSSSISLMTNIIVKDNNMVQSNNNRYFVRYGDGTKYITQISQVK